MVSLERPNPGSKPRPNQKRRPSVLFYGNRNDDAIAPLYSLRGMASMLVKTAQTPFVRRRGRRLIRRAAALAPLGRLPRRTPACKTPDDNHGEQGDPREHAA